MQKQFLCLTLLSIFSGIFAAPKGDENPETLINSEETMEKHNLRNLDYEKLELKYLYAERRIKRAGGLQNMSPASLNELLPKLTTTFEQLSRQNSDFDVNLKRICSGKSQIVLGTHYIVNVETTKKSNVNEVKKCEADILENLKGEFIEVDVKCDHKNKTFRYIKQ